MDSLLWLVIGIAIGWNLPQPSWAKQLEDRVREFFNNRS